MRTTRTTLDSTDTTSDDKAPSLALTIAYHPYVDRVGQRAILTAAANNPTALSRDEPAFFAPGASAGEPLADEHISRTPIFIANAPDGTVHIDVSQSKTKVRIADQRVTGTVTLSSKDIDRGVVLLLGNRIVLVVHRTQQIGRVLGYDKAGELLGESDGLCRVLWDINSVADLEKHVLIRGETGTGKELVAAAIHRLSRRREEKFIPINLAAIPPSLAASELFGAEKGSYTGSLNRHAGYFEKADGGTLLLDEIGEAPPELQVYLLRALDSGEIQTVGASNQARKTNVRIIAATDANLEGKVEEGSFKSALLNRLATFEIWLPPLRERREDIGRLLVSFLRTELQDIKEVHRLERVDDATKPWLPASLAASLIAFDWPGNVRQLKNAVRQLVIGNRGRLHAEKTPALDRILGEKTGQEHAIKENEVDDASSAGKGANAARRKPADVTEAELKDALHECRWDIYATADKLGVARGSLYTLRDRFPWFRTAGLLTDVEINECFIACNGDITLMAEKLQVSESALARRLRELGLALNIKKKKGT